MGLDSQVFTWKCDRCDARGTSTNEEILPTGWAFVLRSQKTARWWWRKARSDSSHYGRGKECCQDCVTSFDQWLKSVEPRPSDPPAGGAYR